MCNSSRKKAFEERASDENKEKEAGGRGWQEGGGADLGASRAGFHLCAQALAFPGFFVPFLGEGCLL